MSATAPIERPLCAAHPERRSIASCARCGRALCAACALEYSGVPHCEVCYRDRCAESAARAASSPGARRTGLFLVLLVGGLALAVGGVAFVIYIAAGPSIAVAKERAKARACRETLVRVHDAAAREARDRGGALPRPADGRLETLVEALVREGYLRERPKRLCEGRVDPVERRADTVAPYLYDDAGRHEGKRNVIGGSGIAETMSDADLEKARGAAPSSPTTTAVPAQGGP